MKQAVDITGQRFGSLVAKELAPQRGRQGQRMWVCSCDCGNESVVMQQSLRSGNTTRCSRHPLNTFSVRPDGVVLLDVSTPVLPGAFSLIDRDDLDTVLNFTKNGHRMRWKAHDAHGGRWGVYVIGSDAKTRLHRVITGVRDSQRIVDHINGDTLDNRKCNLRVITRAENNKNVRKRRNNTSGCTGVWLDKHTGLWVSEIGLRGSKLHLGRFDTIAEANIAYRAAAKALGFSDRHGL